MIIRLRPPALFALRDQERLDQQVPAGADGVTECRHPLAIEIIEDHHDVERRRGDVVGREIGERGAGTRGFLLSRGIDLPEGSPGDPPGTPTVEGLSNQKNALVLHLLDQDGVVRTAAELLAFPDVRVERLAAVWPELRSLPADVAEQVETDSRYAVYLARQEADIAAFRRDESVELPADMNYGSVSGLSGEAREKLEAVRPETLGAAARIEGMTPAALVLLLRHLRRRELKEPARERA